MSEPRAEYGMPHTSVGIVRDAEGKIRWSGANLGPLGDALAAAVEAFVAPHPPTETLSRLRQVSDAVRAWRAARE